MNNNVYIHIGLPKTATSSIQGFLYHNKSFLEEHGYHYIQTGLNHDLKCHHDLVWKLDLHKGPSYVEQDIAKYRNEILRDLAAEVEAHKGKNLVVSSELLTFIGDFRKLKPLLDVFKDKKVKFILNLRRQDRFLESLYQQVVKDGVSLTFDEWLHRSRGIANYNMLVSRLLMVTTKKNVIIDVFDSRIPHLHPTENFLVSLGFDRAYLKSFNIENKKENESLSLEQVHKLRVSNSLNPNLRYELMNQFMEDNNSMETEKAQYLDSEKRQKIIASFHDSNTKMIDMLQIPLLKSRYLLF
ncbi:hypothetical protein YH65_00940 [Sulfurovum lithotrophicum]|uniref:Sulfotransferase domain-containing protein n=1 Tax=Sulfurovum lithotrophicum TaxID=206403 RepID=A0A7U4LZK6_9BACT|nr:hypothetical protein [Sulfurovum lithotrophicum]AKF24128.1 hypothetical protein YH65_00940 [Sulfurovum lithotrophicum]